MTDRLYVETEEQFEKARSTLILYFASMAFVQGVVFADLTVQDIELARASQFGCYNYVLASHNELEDRIVIDPTKFNIKTSPLIASPLYISSEKDDCLLVEKGVRLLVTVPFHHYLSVKMKGERMTIDNLPTFDESRTTS